MEGTGAAFDAPENAQRSEGAARDDE